MGIDEIQCKACQSSTNMCLVAQLYAPMDFDRSLYVFCCNKRICSLSSAGWIVLRNQTTRHSTAVVQPPAIPVPVAAAPAASVWGSWSLDSDGTMAAGDDLEALLAARDNASQLQQQQPSLPQQQAKKQSSHKQSTDNSSDESLLSQALASLGHELSCWEIESSADPFFDSSGHYASKSYYKSCSSTSSRGAADNNGSDDDSDDYDDVPMTAQERQHIDRMLQGYVADEEDTGLVALLQQEISGSSSDLKRQTTITNNSATATTTRDDADDIEDADDNENDDDDDEVGGNTTSSGQTSTQQQHSSSSSSKCRGGSSDTKFARSDRRSRVESHFQRVVAAAPAQVVRYQYGGDPLWCTFPPPVDHDHEHRQQQASSSVPRCEHCGARREFECQLMPGIFALKPLFAHQPRSPQKPANGDEPQTTTAVATGQETLLGETFDFGVVAVYSCPNSCSSSDSNDNIDSNSDSSSRKTTRLRFEFAVVQPPV